MHGAGRLGETLRRQGGTVLATVAFEGATKVYPDGTTAVSSLDLAIPDGQVMVLVGPWGCGKTTARYFVQGLLAGSVK